jgi:hypothetical protein
MLNLQSITALFTFAVISSNLVPLRARAALNVHDTCNYFTKALLMPEPTGFGDPNIIRTDWVIDRFSSIDMAVIQLAAPSTHRLMDAGTLEHPALIADVGAGRAMMLLDEIFTTFSYNFPLITQSMPTRANSQPTTIQDLLLRDPEEASRYISEHGVTFANILKNVMSSRRYVAISHLDYLRWAYEVSPDIRDMSLYQSMSHAYTALQGGHQVTAARLAELQLHFLMQFGQSDLVRDNVDFEYRVGMSPRDTQTFLGMNQVIVMVDYFGPTAYSHDPLGQLFWNYIQLKPGGSLAVVLPTKKIKHKKGSSTSSNIKAIIQKVLRSIDLGVTVWNGKDAVNHMSTSRNPGLQGLGQLFLPHYQVMKRGKSEWLLIVKPEDTALDWNPERDGLSKIQSWFEDFRKTTGEPSLNGDVPIPNLRVSETEVLSGHAPKIKKVIYQQ